METAKTLHTTLLGLIQSGLVKSAHDCSEGGLAVALAESCISQLIARETPRLLGAMVDLSALKVPRLDALLFGETQSRVVISCLARDAVKVVETHGGAGVLDRQGWRGQTLDQKLERRIFDLADRVARCLVEQHCAGNGSNLKLVHVASRR